MTDQEMETCWRGSAGDPEEAGGAAGGEGRGGAEGRRSLPGREQGEGRRGDAGQRPAIQDSEGGTGEKPTLDDTVMCNYKGTLVNGTEFDASRSTAAGDLPVKGVIAGWTEALQLMPAGSKWQLFVPSNLAYGPQGPGDIGPNATLIFEVELVSIQKSAASGAAASK